MCCTVGDGDVLYGRRLRCLVWPEMTASAKSEKGILSILSVLKVFESQGHIWSILSGPVIRIILSDMASRI